MPKFYFIIDQYLISNRYTVSLPIQVSVNTVWMVQTKILKNDEDAV